MTLENAEKTLLSCQSLGLETRREPVFEGISFALKAGQVTAFTGPNASGKTMLLDVLAGRRAPSAGTITWGDKRSTPLTHRYLRQLPQVTCWRTVRGQVMRYCRRHSGEIAGSFAAPVSGLDTAAVTASPMAAIITYLQLEYYLATRMRHLSVGWKQRIAMAELMVAPAPLWLLDDPAALLDDPARHMLSGLTAAHLRKGGGIVVTARCKGDVEAWLPKDAPVQLYDMAHLL